MDLVESEIFQGERHPWETARVDAVRTLLAGRAGAGAATRALDVGCGDGYVSYQVFGPVLGAEVDLVDTYFTAEAAAKMDNLEGRFRFHRSMENAGEGKYDVILLLDVLEHEEDAAALLRRAGSRLADAGTMLVSVPAFQSLFSTHDRFLRHHRRYSLPGLTALAEVCSLSVTASGYLFLSLLAPRAASVLMERGGLASGEAKGIGGWRGGPFVTGLISGYLRMENSLMILLAGAGLRLPGLTAWMICQKPR
jgi:SAM-dependent methyltransferase